MNEILGWAPYAAPVLFAAAGELVSERAGVVGIHTEGMMLGAALAGVLVAGRTGSPALGLLAGLGASVVLAAIFGLLVLGRREDQVVVGTGVNLLALGGTGAAFRAAYGESGALVSVPRLGWPTLVVGLGLVTIVGPVLMRTRFGLALRGVGEAPAAVEAAGFSPMRLRWGAILLAALFAGLGGAYLSLGVAGSFAPGMTAGRGFVAIALVSFGRWKPMWTAAGALLVGFAEAAQYRIQGSFPGVPSQLPLMLPYVLTLVVLVVAGPGARAPEALGRAYRRGE